MGSRTEQQIRNGPRPDLYRKPRSPKFSILLLVIMAILSIVLALTVAYILV